MMPENTLLASLLCATLIAVPAVAQDDDAGSAANNDDHKARALVLESSRPVTDPRQITPGLDVVEQVRRAMGNTTPHEQAQTREQLRVYEQANQYSAPVERMSVTYPVRLHEPPTLSLQLVDGYDTELLLYDMHGNPWKVGEVSAGNKTLLTATQSQILPHAIRLSAATGQYAGRTNVKLYVDGLDTSVSLPVEINRGRYHDTVKIVLPGMVPPTEGETTGRSELDSEGVGLQALDDRYARAILDNPINPLPDECQSRDIQATSIVDQPLKVESVAFVCAGHTYIRTRSLVGAKPGLSGVIYGPDQYRVWRYSGQGEYFSFRDTASGRPIFLVLKRPSHVIGARYGVSSAGSDK